jgi:hypothetical protein
MKYKITAPRKTNEILYGIEFRNGVGYSNNDYVVSVLKESGYVVEESKLVKKKETEDVH